MPARLLVLPLLAFASCGTVAVQRAEQAQIDPAAPFHVELEFDGIDLASTIRKSLREHGYAIAESPDAAQYLWTGEFSADHDLIHNRFNFARFKIVDVATNEVLCRLMIGQGGFSSVESHIDEMVLGLGPPPVVPAGSAWQAPQE